MKDTLKLPQVFPVTCHTNYVGPGSTFIAIKGYKEDGTNYIHLALEKGATTIIVQIDTKLSADIKKQITKKGAQIQYVENTRATLAHLSAHVLNYPAKKLQIIGITGTKGKTTTTFLVEHILKEAGYKTAQISSVNNAILGKSKKSSLTTPPADYLQIFFDQCVKNGVEWVVVEVAAHALALDRTAGISFDGIVFTNFESEHLEFFKDLNEYFNTKLRIFEQLKPNAPAFINDDNSWCRKIPSYYPFIKRFGLDKPKLDITALVDHGWEHRLSFTVPWQTRKHRLMCPTLFGYFNAYNIIGAVGISLNLNIPMETIAAALYSFPGVPGRQDYYKLPNGAICIIDYAHTPESFKAILSFLRLYTDHLIVVFGAGGERDPKKRPLIGKEAATYADIIILTTDNPRSENPYQIIEDIFTGIPPEKKNNVLHEVDRAKAIKKAYSLSSENSIITILGKGAEKYQIIGNSILPFSDKVTILELS